MTLQGGEANHPGDPAGIPESTPAGVVTSAAPAEHHIWCNHFMRPREGCAMCEGLYREYPPGGLSPSELLARHFPDVTPRTAAPAGACSVWRCPDCNAVALVGLPHVCRQG